MEWLVLAFARYSSGLEHDSGQPPVTRTTIVNAQAQQWGAERAVALPY
jgi:hypothetical protein